MSKLHALPTPKTRISAKVRAAIEIRVKQGLSIEASAKAAGMSKAGIFKTLYKVRAYEAALDLMLHAKSEAVRARMVEFLSGDGKSPQVAVHVDARQTGGYEYAPPGSRVVEIEQGDGSSETSPSDDPARESSA